MNIIGYHVDVSAREMITLSGPGELSAEAGGRRVPGIAGVVDQTDLPNIMDLSDNILLAHYQRERR